MMAFARRVRAAVRLPMLPLAAVAAVVSLAALPGCDRRDGVSGTLRIGVVCDLARHNPDRHAGEVTVRSAAVVAGHFNAAGGLEVGDGRYLLEVVVVDADGSPARAVEKAEQLVGSEEIRLFVGPDDGGIARRVIPVLEASRALVVHFGRDAALTRESGPLCLLAVPVPAQGYAVLLRHLKSAGGPDSIAFISGNTDAGLAEMAAGEALARSAGFDVRHPEVYDIVQRTFDSSVEAAVQRGRLARIIGLGPEAVALADVPPRDLPGLLEMLREEGFAGPVVSARFHDARIVARAGDAADGFACLAVDFGDSPPSDYFNQLKADYQRRFEVWDESAALKFHAFDALLRMVQAAGPDALQGTVRIEALPVDHDWPDPFVDGPRRLKLTGEADFGRACQLELPFGVVEFRGGAFTPAAPAAGARGAGNER